MKRIYYIENDFQHLQAVKNFLDNNGYETSPNLENWGGELTDIQNFIHDQSDDGRRAALRKIFENYMPDLVLIDVDLGCNQSGTGKDIYNNFMLAEKSLYNIPIIYLTVADDEIYKMNRKVRHVKKKISGMEMDISQTGPELKKVIEELISPNENRGFFDRFIDSI